MYRRSMNSDVYKVPNSPSMLVYLRASRFFREHNGKMNSPLKPTITLERLQMPGLTPKDANICENESPACMHVILYAQTNKHAVNGVTPNGTASTTS